MQNKNYTQLCVWEGANLGDKTGKDFQDHMTKEFGVRTKYEDVLITLPTIGLPGSGGRTDLIFYIHNEDIAKFAVPRLEWGIRWWEDVLLNGGDVLYTGETLRKYLPAS